MRQTQADTLVKIAEQDDDDTLVILAPNYEPRSGLGAKEFISKIAETDSRIKFGIITFRSSSYRVELLEYLKDINYNEIDLSLSKKNHRPIDKINLRYPNEVLDRKLKGMMQDFASQLTQHFSIILDISSLPREALIIMLDIIQMYRAEGRLKRFFFLYSWAGGYPQLHYPAEVGELVTISTYRHVRAIFKSQSRIRAVQAAVFIGRQGFDAKQFVAALPDNRIVNVHVFMNRENVFHSMGVIRANAATLTDPSVNVHYYLTLTSGHEKLVRWARECAIEENTAYLIAPFGPKPLVISSWLASRELQRRGQDKAGVLADVVLLGEHQYSTTYSIGFKSISAFNLDIP